jgi:hypothetical protein
LQTTAPKSIIAWLYSAGFFLSSNLPASALNAFFPLLSQLVPQFQKFLQAHEKHYHLLPRDVH